MWIEVDTHASEQGIKGIWVPLPIPGYAASSAPLSCHPSHGSGVASIDERVADPVWRSSTMTLGLVGDA